MGERKKRGSFMRVSATLAGYIPPRHLGRKGAARIDQVLSCPNRPNAKQKCRT